MGKYNVGDRVRRVKNGDQNGFCLGDVGKIEEGHLSGTDNYYSIKLESGELSVDNFEGNLELEFENSPSKNVTKMKKTIYHVLAVDKKTGKEVKNVTISADNEQQAILKAFDVDAENTFIKATEVGSYEEDKPLKAVLEKPQKE